MLQFWIPRSEKVDIAKIHSLRSFLPNEFDTKSERITINILKRLSRYENIDDLSEDAIASILVNGALRNRISESESEDEEQQMIHDAILNEFDEARKEAQRKSQEAHKLQSELRERENKLRSVKKEKNQLEDSIEQLANQVRSLKQERKVAENRKDNFEPRIDKLQESHEEEVKKRRRTEAINRLMISVIVGLILICSSVYVAIEFGKDGLNTLAKLNAWWGMIGMSIGAAFTFARWYIGEEGRELLGLSSRS
jgi:Fe2+ transport system protein B